MNSSNAKNAFRILYLVLNRFTNSARIMRATQTCSEMGGTATVFALHDRGLAVKEVIGGIEIQRFRMVTWRLPKYPYAQLLKCIEYFSRLVLAAVGIRPEIIYANDPLTLTVGFIVARLTKTRLIYDSHELYSGVDIKGFFPKWAFRLSLLPERILAKKVDVVITVSDGISSQMAKSMGINRPYVVRNIPRRKQGVVHRKKSGLLRNTLGIKQERPVILYQGGMNAERGILTLVEALALLEHESAVLVFLGNGPLVSEIKAMVNTYGLGKRVYFHPAVSPDILLDWTRGADVGVHPIKGTCQNHRLCLPNKLFEYIQARLPVVVTDLPEMKKVVEKYGVGEVFRDGDVEDLAAKIDYVLMSKHKYRSAVSAAAKELNWDVEKHRLIDVYKTVLSR